MNNKKNIRKILIILGIIVVFMLFLHLAGPHILQFAKEMHGLD